MRLGDLDARYLRHPEAKQMIDFAQKLFDTTAGAVPPGEAHCAQLWAAAARLSQVR